MCVFKFENTVLLKPLWDFLVFWSDNIIHHGGFYNPRSCLKKSKVGVRGWGGGVVQEEKRKERKTNGAGYFDIPFFRVTRGSFNRNTKRSPKKLLSCKRPSRS